jgi:hypothetical protein
LVNPVSQIEGVIPPSPISPIYSNIPDSFSSYPLPPIAPTNKSRPFLDPPDKEDRYEEKIQVFVSNVVAYMNVLEDIQRIYLERLDDDFTGARVQLGERFQTHLKERHKIEEAMQAESWWDYSRKITTLLLAGTALLAGGAVFSAAPGVFQAAVGVGMMTSGALTVIAESLYQSGTHKDVANAMVLVGSIVGLTSGIVGLFHHAAPLSSLAFQFLIASTSLASNVTHLNKENWARIAEEFKAKNLLSQNELEKLQRLTDILSTDAQGFVSILERNISEVSKLSNRYQRTKEQIQSAFTAA